MKPKNILIVCWDFPPNDEIGGRRWAKIARSLLRAGHNVSVIRKDAAPSGKPTAWISKAELDQMKHYTCQKHWLVRWLNDYSSRVKLHLAELLLKVFYKGTIFDKAIGIESPFTKLAADVIRKDAIDLVVVSGAPFNLIYYTAQLKKQFPNVKILADYRDPWINAQNYGMSNLKPGRRQHELAKQNFVFENVDYITAPNGFLLQEIKDTYTGNSSQLAQFIELPHAFDPADFVKAPGQPAASGKIKIVYAGTLYIGVDSYLQLLNNAISYIKKQGGPVPEFDFYTNDLGKQSLFNENKDVVKFSKSIGDKIFEEIQSATFLLIILSEHNKNYVTSKFFEFLPYRKPYLYVGPEGFVAKKIEESEVGYCLRQPADLADILSKTGSIKVPTNEGISRYTFDSVMAELLQNISFTA